MGTFTIKIGLVLVLTAIVAQVGSEPGFPWSPFGGTHHHHQHGTNPFNAFKKFGEGIAKKVGRAVHEATKKLHLNLRDIFKGIHNLAGRVNGLKVLGDGTVQLTWHSANYNEHTAHIIWKFVLQILEKFKAENPEVVLNNGMKVSWDVVFSSLKESLKTADPASLSAEDKAMWEYVWNILEKNGFNIIGLPIPKGSSAGWEYLFKILRTPESESPVRLESSDGQQVSREHLKRVLEERLEREPFVRLENGRRVRSSLILNILERGGPGAREGRANAEEKQVWRFLLNLLQGLGYKIVQNKGTRPQWRALELFVDDETESRHQKPSSSPWWPNIKLPNLNFQNIFSGIFKFGLSLPGFSSLPGGKVKFTWPSGEIPVNAANAVWNLLIGILQHFQTAGHTTVELGDGQKISWQLIIKTLQDTVHSSVDDLTDQQKDIWNFVYKLLPKVGFSFVGLPQSTGGQEPWEFLFQLLNKQTVTQNSNVLQNIKLPNINLGNLFHGIFKFGLSLPGFSPLPGGKFKFTWPSGEIPVNAANAVWKLLITVLQHIQTAGHTTVELGDGQKISWQLIIKTLQDTVHSSVDDLTDQQKDIWNFVYELLPKVGFSFVGLPQSTGDQEPWEFLFQLLNKQTVTQNSNVLQNIKLPNINLGNLFHGIFKFGLSLPGFSPLPGGKFKFTWPSGEIPVNAANAVWKLLITILQHIQTAGHTTVELGDGQKISWQLIIKTLQDTVHSSVDDLTDQQKDIWNFIYELLPKVGFSFVGLPQSTGGQEPWEFLFQLLNKQTVTQNSNVLQNIKLPNINLGNLFHGIFKFGLSLPGFSPLPGGKFKFTWPSGEIPVNAANAVWKLLITILQHIQTAGHTTVELGDGQKISWQLIIKTLQDTVHSSVDDLTDQQKDIWNFVYELLPKVGFSFVGLPQSTGDQEPWEFLFQLLNKQTVTQNSNVLQNIKLPNINLGNLFHGIFKFGLSLPGFSPLPGGKFKFTWPSGEIPVNAANAVWKLLITVLQHIQTAGHTTVELGDGQKISWQLIIKTLQDTVHSSVDDLTDQQKDIWNFVYELLPKVGFSFVGLPQSTGDQEPWEFLFQLLNKQTVTQNSNVLQNIKLPNINLGNLFHGIFKFGLSLPGFSPLPGGKFKFTWPSGEIPVNAANAVWKLLITVLQHIQTAGHTTVELGDGQKISWQLIIKTLQDTVHSSVDDLTDQQKDIWNFVYELLPKVGFSFVGLPQSTGDQEPWEFLFQLLNKQTVTQNTNVLQNIKLPNINLGNLFHGIFKFGLSLPGFSPLPGGKFKFTWPSGEIPVNAANAVWKLLITTLQHIQTAGHTTVELGDGQKISWQLIIKTLQDTVHSSVDDLTDQQKDIWNFVYELLPKVGFSFVGLPQSTGDQEPWEFLFQLLNKQTVTQNSNVLQNIKLPNINLGNLFHGIFKFGLSLPGFSPLPGGKFKFTWPSGDIPVNAANAIWKLLITVLQHIQTAGHTTVELGDGQKISWQLIIKTLQDTVHSSVDDLTDQQKDIWYFVYELFPKVGFSFVGLPQSTGGQEPWEFLFQLLNKQTVTQNSNVLQNIKLPNINLGNLFHGIFKFGLSLPGFSPLPGGKFKFTWPSGEIPVNAANAVWKLLITILQHIQTAGHTTVELGDGQKISWQLIIKTLQDTVHSSVDDLTDQQKDIWNFVYELLPKVGFSFVGLPQSTGDQEPWEFLFQLLNKQTVTQNSNVLQNIKLPNINLGNLFHGIFKFGLSLPGFSPLPGGKFKFTWPSGEIPVNAANAVWKLLITILQHIQTAGHTTVELGDGQKISWQLIIKTLQDTVHSSVDDLTDQQKDIWNFVYELLPKVGFSFVGLPQSTGGQEPWEFLFQLLNKQTVTQNSNVLQNIKLPNINLGNLFHGIFKFGLSLPGFSPLPGGKFKFTWPSGEIPVNAANAVWKLLITVLQHIQTAGHTTVELGDGQKISWQLILKTLQDTVHSSVDDLTDQQKDIWNFVYELLPKVGFSFVGLPQSTGDQEPWEFLFQLLNKQTVTQNSNVLQNIKLPNINLGNLFHGIFKFGLSLPGFSPLPGGKFKFTWPFGEIPVNAANAVWKLLITILQHIQTAGHTTVELGDGQKISWQLIIKTLQDTVHSSVDDLTDQQKDIWNFVYELLPKVGFSFVGLPQSTGDQEPWEFLFQLLNKQTVTQNSNVLQNIKLPNINLGNLFHGIFKFGLSLPGFSPLPGGKFKFTWPSGEIPVNAAKAVWKLLITVLQHIQTVGHTTVELGDGQKISWQLIIKTLQDTVHSSVDDLTDQQKDIWNFVYELLPKVGFSFVGLPQSTGDQEPWEFLFQLLNKQTVTQNSNVLQNIKLPNINLGNLFHGIFKFGLSLPGFSPLPGGKFKFTWPSGEIPVNAANAVWKLLITVLQHIQTVGHTTVELGDGQKISWQLIIKTLQDTVHSSVDDLTDQQKDIWNFVYELLPNVGFSFVGLPQSTGGQEPWEFLFQLLNKQTVTQNSNFWENIKLPAVNFGNLFSGILNSGLSLPEFSSLPGEKLQFTWPSGKISIDTANIVWNLVFKILGQESLAGDTSVELDNGVKVSWRFIIKTLQDTVHLNVDQFTDQEKSVWNFVFGLLKKVGFSFVGLPQSTGDEAPWEFLLQILNSANVNNNSTPVKTNLISETETTESSEPNISDEDKETLVSTIQKLKTDGNNVNGNIVYDGYTIALENLWSILKIQNIDVENVSPNQLQEIILIIIKNLNNTSTVAPESQSSGVSEEDSATISYLLQYLRTNGFDNVGEITFNGVSIPKEYIMKILSLQNIGIQNVTPQEFYNILVLYNQSVGRSSDQPQLNENIISSLENLLKILQEHGPSVTGYIIYNGQNISVQSIFKILKLQNIDIQDETAIGLWHIVELIIKTQGASQGTVDEKAIALKYVKKLIENSVNPAHDYFVFDGEKISAQNLAMDLILPFNIQTGKYIADNISEDDLWKVLLKYVSDAGKTTTTN